MADHLPTVDWEWLRSQMTACPWSSEAREAGLWAIGTLQEQLGPRWPKAWIGHGCAPPELVMSGSMLTAFASTLSLALAFSELQAVDGIGSLRATVRGTARADALASPRLQLRMASLAASIGLDVKLEPKLPKARTKADLLIATNGISIPIEVLAVLRDKKSLDAEKWLGPFNIELLLIGQRHHVDFKGVINEPLDEGDTATLLEEVERWSGGIAAGLTMPDLRSGGVSIEIIPAPEGGGRIDFRYPTVPFDRRLANKLAKKAAQTLHSGASWLLIDSLDHLWHLTGWSHLTLADKARALADLFRRQLGTKRHLLGVVITDGAALWRPEAREETVDIEGDAVALCRRIDKGHIRESVIVPLQGLGLEAGHVWRQILDAENRWLGHAVERIGLRLPLELANDG